MMSQRITRVDNEEELVEAFKVSFTVMSDQGGMTPNLRKWEGKVCPPYTHTSQSTVVLYKYKVYSCVG